jgi:hypothetical protein
MDRPARRYSRGLPLLLSLFSLEIAETVARSQTPSADRKVDISALWEEPADLEQRDLFLGPGGRELAPAGDSFEFVARDTSGTSPGFDVRDATGRLWSVKLGVEAQSEVAASRILWAIGFHQKPTYYVPAWKLTGQVQGAQAAGRFRPELPGEKVIGDWSWRENPFVGTRQYQGLIVANLILNSWDWKTSNNKIYEVRNERGGVRRQYVVRDLGASLGRTSQPPALSALGIRAAQGTKNDLDGFEAQGFVEVDGDGDLDFVYHGMYDEVVARAGREDLRWTCGLLARLSDKQLADAFRAAGYTPEQSARYVKKLREKIAAGLAAAGR